jgi:hypothetical protein
MIHHQAQIPTSWPQKPERSSSCRQETLRWVFNDFMWWIHVRDLAAQPPETSNNGLDIDVEESSTTRELRFLVADKITAWVQFSSFRKLKCSQLHC